MTPTSTKIARSDRTLNAFALLITVAAALLLLRLPLVQLPALWIDEAFSLYHARLPLSHLWSEGWRLESSPPLYYSALWAWIRLVADSEASARLFSVLLTGVASLYVYRAARGLAGPLAGAASVVIWLLTCLGLEFSLEIRPYALQLCWIALAAASFVTVTAAGAASRWRNGRDVVAGMAPIVLATTAAFYTHTTSVTFICGLAAAGLYFGWASDAGRRYFQVWAGACIAVTLLCLPQIFAAWGVLASNRSGLAWIPSTLDHRVLSQVVRQWALGSLPWGYELAGPLTGLMFAVFAVSAWRLRGNAALIALCVVMPATGALLLVLAGIIQPVLLTRTALWLWIPMAMLLGCAALSLEWRGHRWRWLIPVVLVVFFLGTSAAYLTARAAQRPWSASFSALAERSRPGDRILVFDGELACVFDHYAEGKISTLPRFRIDLGREQRFRSGQRLNIVCNRLAVIDATAVAPVPGSGDWVLTDGDQQRADLTTLIRRSGEPLQITDTVIWAGQARASRIVRTPRP